MNIQSIKSFQNSVNHELFENIVPFWLKYSLDEDHGGFIGRMESNLQLQPEAPKGLILNARILWTFSNLYRFQKNAEFEKMAVRAYEYISQKFYDTEHDGYFWTLTFLGEPHDTSKKSYGQAFVVYALSEFASAFGNRDALHQAHKLFHLMESRCQDIKRGGYYETFTRDWDIADDLRLSSKDMDEKKSMNAHLHVLEAYSNLYRITGDQQVKAALQKLLQIFLNSIINHKNHHFNLFFNENWDIKTDRISFGHDIEGSWLLWEAAELLKNPEILKNTRKTILSMVEAVKNRGVDKDGGVFYEGDPSGIIDSSKDWWPQAEAAVGFLNACLISNNVQYFECAQKSWQFVLDYISDKEHGEWFWKVSKDHIPDVNEFKVCEWKGPYHNVRACIEILKRLDQLNGNE